MEVLLRVKARPIVVVCCIADQNRAYVFVALLTLYAVGSIFLFYFYFRIIIKYGIVFIFCFVFPSIPQRLHYDGITTLGF